MDISAGEVLKLLRKTLAPEQLDRSLVYWYKYVFQEGEPVDIVNHSLTMPYKGTLVFVDLAPKANWAHPCLYVLIDQQAINAKVINASLPPNIDQFDENYITILRYGHIPPS